MCSAERDRKFVADLLPKSACPSPPGCTKRRCCLSRRRFTSGRARTLLSMRPRGSSSAVAVGSGAVGEGASCGIAWKLASRACNASLTLSPSAGVRVFVLGQAWSVQPSRLSSTQALPVRRASDRAGLPRLQGTGQRDGVRLPSCEAAETLLRAPASRAPTGTVFPFRRAVLRTWADPGGAARAAHRGRPRRRSRPG